MGAGAKVATAIVAELSGGDRCSGAAVAVWLSKADALLIYALTATCHSRRRWTLLGGAQKLVVRIRDNRWWRPVLAHGGAVANPGRN